MNLFADLIERSREFFGDQVIRVQKHRAKAVVANGKQVRLFPLSYNFI